MTNKLIGREEEQKMLSEVMDKPGAHFIAVTGRRRVGKTYLIKSFFDKKLDFEFTGMLNTTHQQQLLNFQMAMRKSFKLRKKEKAPKNWLIAFHQLAYYLDKIKKKKKPVVFIDELPWLDTHKSNFLTALDWFWNSRAANRDIVLIVCGSSTSWMINNLINDKGGLHNRITKRIHLAPFTLSETRKYLRYQGITLSDYHLLQIYMVFGGVPHYLKEMNKGESVVQAINRICFQKSGLLVNEFQNLYRALFKHSELHERVVRALSSTLKGLTRQEILRITKLKDGGTFTKVLEELEWCNFIGYSPSYGKLKKESLYRLMDEYSLFYLRFMHKKKNVNWIQLASTGNWKSWSGYAFEGICIKHISKLKKALGIDGIHSENYGFIYRGNKKEIGTQIDLIIDRNDKAINLCEIKFSDSEFTIDKKYSKVLRNKVSVFKKVTHTRKSIFPTFISTYGLMRNSYSGWIQQEVKMDDFY